MKYALYFVAAMAMFADTFLPIIASDHIGWLRWRIPIILCALVAFLAFGLYTLLSYREENRDRQKQAERDREREHREDAREQRLQESQTKLVALAIAEYRASVEQKEPAQAGPPPSSPPPRRMTHDSAMTLEMTLDDPRIYLDIEPEPNGMFSRTPFVLSNQGKTTAHNVSIQPFTLSQKAIVFPLVAAVPAGDRRTALPTTDDKGFGLVGRQNIFYWLMKDWNDRGELVEELLVPVSVKYNDPLGQKTFETAMTLVFYPIRHMLDEKHNRQSRRPTWEFRNITFKLLPQPTLL